MRAWLVLLIATGCDQLFGIQHFDHGGSGGGSGDGGIVPPDAGMRCMQNFDPIRYYSVTASAGYTQAAARVACKRAGMDLVVIDDANEGAAVGSTSKLPHPFWIGMSGDGNAHYTLDDGCPLYEQWELISGVGKCVYFANTGFIDTGCVTQSGTTGLLHGGCEVPLAAPTCHSGTTTDDYPVGPVTFADARLACPTGTHLVEINSSVELMQVTLYAQAVGMTPFWLGATFDGAQWQSESGCPQAFPWVTQPNPAAGMCVQWTDMPAMGAIVVSCSNTGWVFCEDN